MKAKKNKKNIIKITIIVCIVLIIILLFLLIALKSKIKENNNETVVETQEAREVKVTDYVRTRSEKERMQVYLAEYIKHIERGEYTSAYEKLYPDFRKNYFETESEFVSYVKRYYSDLMMLDYEDIQRQGNYYILSVKITNMQEAQTEISQKFIIYENGLNDYYISFQVKY